MKRKHKLYSRPKRPFDKTRIDSEAIIKKDFGLKNKKEIWKSVAKIKKFREQAKRLIKASPEQQQNLFKKLAKIGIKTESIADVLSLNTEDYLKRRLQSFLVQKKFATTPKMARQLITHKKVLVNGSVVNIPSFIIPVEMEDKITVKKSLIKPKKKEVKEKGDKE